GDLEIPAHRNLQPVADALAVRRDNHLHRRSILDVANITARQIDTVNAHIELRRLPGAERKAVSCAVGIGTRLLHFARMEDAVPFQDRWGGKVHPSPAGGCGNGHGLTNQGSEPARQLLPFWIAVGRCAVQWDKWAVSG